jgi:class 3 adenylate cyclase
LAPHSECRIAVNFLTTYVGKNAGERVLAGHIRRGDTETIHAAIWLSDMRGFTSLADTLPPLVECPLLTLSRHIAGAFECPRGKADMAFCGANVCL